MQYNQLNQNNQFFYNQFNYTIDFLKFLKEELYYLLLDFNEQAFYHLCVAISTILLCYFSYGYIKNSHGRFWFDPIFNYYLSRIENVRDILNLIFGVISILYCRDFNSIYFMSNDCLIILFFVTIKLLHIDLTNNDRMHLCLLFNFVYFITYYKCNFDFDTYNLRYIIISTNWISIYKNVFYYRSEKHN